MHDSNKTDDLVVVVNDQDEVIGTTSRRKAHTEGIPHRISVVWLMNDAGNFLIHERHNNLWDHSCAGHVDPGESYEQTAQRELSEELNISEIELEFLVNTKFVKSHQNDQVVHHFNMYLGRVDQVVHNPAEVKSIRWMTRDEVVDLINSNPDGVTEHLKFTFPLLLEHM